MSWKESMRQASFRGVKFHVQGHEHSVGRRVQQHEFPLRDKPTTEDLGRKARTWRVDAFVLGPDYMAARDELLAALEAEGPGTLVHPWLGTARVTVANASLRETTAKGGMASFSIEFQEAGEDAAPSTATDTGWVVSNAASGSRTAAKTEFLQGYETDGYPEHVRTDAAEAVQEIADELGDALSSTRAASGTLSDIQGGITNMSGQASELVSSPADLADQLQGVLASLQNLDFTASSGAFSSLSDLGLSTSWGNQADGSFVTAATGTSVATSTRALANRAALAALVRRIAATEACEAASDAEFAASGDALDVRDELGDRLDQEMATASDDTFSAMRTLRAAMVSDLTERGARLPDLTTYRTGATQPALVVAYRLYGDATRADEVVSRNASTVRHPGYVPGGEDLEVLDA